MFNVSKTYQIVTHESALNGDFEKTGFAFQDAKMSLSDLLHMIEYEGFLELSCSNIDCLESSRKENRVWINTVDTVKDREYFENSRDKYYGLHINCQERHFYKICKLANLLKKKSPVKKECRLIVPGRAEYLETVQGYDAKACYELKNGRMIIGNVYKLKNKSGHKRHLHLRRRVL